MFGGGLIAAALCSGGGGNTGGDIIDKIIALPVVNGGGVGSEYHYLLHCGNVGNGIPTNINYYSPNSGDRPIHYAHIYSYPLCFWFVLYNNETNEPVFAVNVNAGPNVIGNYGNGFSERYEYQTYAINGTGEETISTRVYSQTKRTIEGVVETLAQTTVYGKNYRFKAYYTDRITNYLRPDPDNPNTNVYDPHGVTTVRTGDFDIGNITIPCDGVSAAFFTKLLPADFVQEMVKLVSDITSQIA